ncbi:putative disease resistance protein [Vitis vinifera]|uniref:Putative disease resistance protein n=1 Tax=Vitis vinifera TaxID=29760 RepID=A0A438DJF2_VITVI|nr:putative disease resistance protein [Vitis vinifera]
MENGEKLTDLLSQEAFLLSRVEEQVKLLSSELEWMRLFLKDADAKRRYDPRIKLWVSQIRDVTYDAEDVIDRFMFEMNHQQQGSLKCLKFLKLRFVPKLESRIREINTKIEKIMANKSRYGVETLPAASSSNEVVPHKERRAPIVEEVNVVGIQEDAKSVKQNLLNGEMRRAVVSIVAWVAWERLPWLRKELLLGVAVCVRILSEEERSKMNESDLGNSLRDYLTTRKYLIFMDDMWRNEAWDRLGLYFPDSVNGSRVLITSRNKEIGLYADPQTIPHELSFLTEEESWELFLKKIFLAGSANAVCPRELEELGKKIVANCGGLPLAIVVLGGLLSRKEKTPLSWQKVLDSLTWHLNQEDSEIRTDKLIRLWVAEGFIQRRGEEIAEDVAEDHLQELCSSTNHSSGRVKLLTVLDLERMPINTIPEGIGELIHLKYLCLRRTRIKRLPSSIRHLYCRGVVSSQSVIDKCRNGPLRVGHLTNLQSLGLRAGSWCCGEGLGKLVELRELTIEWTKIAQTKNHGFSESVKKLTALQSLRLYTLGEEMLTLPHLMPFSDHTYLYHLSLSGRLERARPNVTLEKLPKLEISHVIPLFLYGKEDGLYFWRIPATRNPYALGKRRSGEDLPRHLNIRSGEDRIEGGGIRHHEGSGEVS